MQRIQSFFQMQTKKEKIFLLIFLLIFSIGIFLRTYQFHDWLHFGSDQARDLVIAEDVVTQSAPWPLLGADASNTHFKLGPIYYYFQIISVKIFGLNDIASVAYPDLFFSLLSIPLFYFFVRKYFEQNIALAVTFIYTISFYIIEFSRFAWNQNPIPFFSMLFLISLMELYTAREKTSFWWMSILGLTIGVSIQLHTLLLLLFPAIFSLVALSLIWKEWRIWWKIGLILVIVLILNAGQITSEMKTHNANSKLFMIAFTDRSGSGVTQLSDNLQSDILAHAQANTHILSSLGDKWVVNFSSVVSYPKKSENIFFYGMAVFGVVLSVLFSFCGYGLLAWGFWKESNEKKKIFLGIILLYVTLSFLILFSVARGAPLRYFIHTTFVPFILLGLILEWFHSRVSKKFHTTLVFIVFCFLIFANSYSIFIEALHLSQDNRGDKEWVVLGEAEKIADFMDAQLTTERKATLIGGTKYVSTYHKSLRYLTEKKGIELKRGDIKKDEISSDKIYFFIGKSSESGGELESSEFDYVANKDFGRISIYQLKKKQ